MNDPVFAAMRGEIRLKYKVQDLKEEYATLARRLSQIQRKAVIDYTVPAWISSGLARELEAIFDSKTISEYDKDLRAAHAKIRHYQWEEHHLDKLIERLEEQLSQYGG